MKPREVIVLGVGLVIGLAVGVALMSNEPLRTSIYGTAKEPGQPDELHFQVPFSAVTTWLEEEHAQIREELGGAVEEVAALNTLPAEPDDLLSAQESIDMTLTGVHLALLGADAETTENLEDTPEFQATKVCLGLDINPRLGEPTLYVYVTVTPDQEKLIPEDWEKLDRSRENDIFWLLLGCQPPAAEAGS